MTTTNVKLHARPGESSRVVARVKSGTTLHVLTRDGRWIYVRNGGKRGWVTRTTVRVPGQVARAKRNKRWRRKAADWGKDKSRKGATATDSKPTDPFAEDTASASADDAGGSIDDDPALASSGATADVEVARAPSVPPPPARTGLQASAALGMRSMLMDYLSDGQSGLGDYLITTSAASAQFSGGGRIGVGRVRLGAGLDYRASYAAPGIHYQPSDGSAEGDVGFAVHEVAASITAGARLTQAAGGVDLHARAGYRYSAFLVDKVDNVALLPSESWSGLVVGGLLELPHVTDTIGVALHYDRMVDGSRSQTEGLSDGTMSNVSASWLGVQIDKQLSNRFLVTLGYAYQHSETHWAGPSSRQSDITWARRKDHDHGFTAGVAQRF